MEKYKLKKSILVKDNKNMGALVFSIDEDQVYQFVGDSSLALILLSRESKKEGISFVDMQKELVEISESFKNNKFQNDCLVEFFDKLQKLGLLDPEG